MRIPSRRANLRLLPRTQIPRNSLLDGVRRNLLTCPNVATPSSLTYTLTLNDSICCFFFLGIFPDLSTNGAAEPLSTSRIGYHLRVFTSWALRALDLTPRYELHPFRHYPITPELIPMMIKNEIKAMTRHAAIVVCLSMFFTYPLKHQPTALTCP